jgi:pimeloyl-[acyl-carrier protein] methyl ester esterase
MTTLVLLPGLDGTGTLFDDFIAALPKTTTPVVIRYPAHEALSYPELLEFIEEHLPDGSFAVLGESFSGPLAIELAAKCDRVKAVILCATFTRSPVWVPPFLVSPLWFRVLPRCIIAKVLLGTFRAPALSRAIGMVPARVIAARVRRVLAVDVRKKMKTLRAPVLSIAGSRDWLVRRRDFGGETVVLDAPHLILQSEPEAAARVVARFLEKVDSVH